MRSNNSFASLIFILILAIGAGIAYSTYGGPADAGGATVMIIITFIIAMIVASSIKVASQWEKAIVLRLGEFRVIISFRSSTLSPIGLIPG